MNSKDIANALKARLAGMAGAPSIAWPGVDFDPGTVPRFEVAFPSRETDDPTIKGGTIHREQGTMRVIVCTELGRGEDAGLDYLDAIRARFPKGLRIAITGGRITIMAEPTADAAAFLDDTSYRLPVAFRYHAAAT